MKESQDEIRHGYVWNGFDYKLQVWVIDGLIQDCNHSKEMKGKECCNEHRLADQSIFLVAAAEKDIPTITIEGRFYRRPS